MNIVMSEKAEIFRVTDFGLVENIVYAPRQAHELIVINLNELNIIS